MRFFVKAIATGFAMSMGSAIFKKVSGKMGLDGQEASPEAAEQAAKESADESESESDSETSPEEPAP